MTSRKRRKIAVLTQAEDRAWVEAFNYHIERGKTDAQADELAWRDIKKEFPRLNAFQGCK